MNPDGKLAIVTGGASGIGSAVARLLARKGARVAIADLDEPRASEVATSIRSAGGQAWAVGVDLSRPDQIDPMLSAAVSEHGPLQILYNGAGLVSGQPDFPLGASDRIALLIAVNLTATIVATRAAIAAMSATGGGVVINVSSMAALAPSHPDPVYGASKAAVRTFTAQCAADALARGVRVNAILPGAVDTPIIRKTGDGSSPAPWLTERLGQITLLAPEAIANTVLQLIEDDSQSGAAVTILNDASREQPAPTLG